MNDDVTLKPCYSFRQLINEEILQSIENSVLLLFLPGSHIIPENHTLNASFISELEIYPMNDQKVVNIECQAQAGVVVQGVDNLKIHSGNFSSCTLWYIQTDGFLKLCHFEKCGFQSSNQ